jgi:hypothetical protein
MGAIPVLKGGWCRQRIVDPLQPVAAQFSTGFTRYEGVKPDNAQRVFVDEILLQANYRHG